MLAAALFILSFSLNALDIAAPCKPQILVVEMSALLGWMNDQQIKQTIKPSNFLPF